MVTPYDEVVYEKFANLTEADFNDLTALTRSPDVRQYSLSYTYHDKCLTVSLTVVWPPHMAPALHAEIVRLLPRCASFNLSLEEDFRQARLLGCSEPLAAQISLKGYLLRA